MITATKKIATSILLCLIIIPVQAHLITGIKNSTYLLTPFIAGFLTIKLFLYGNQYNIAQGDLVTLYNLRKTLDKLYQKKQTSTLSEEENRILTIAEEQYAKTKKETALILGMDALAIYYLIKNVVKIGYAINMPGISWIWSMNLPD